MNRNLRSLKKWWSSQDLAGSNCGVLWSPWAGIGGTIGGDIVAVRQIKLSDNLEQLVMATELMGSVKFKELVMGWWVRV